MDANAPIGTVHQMGIVTYDSTGAPHNLQLTFTKTATGTWTWTPTCATAAATPAGTGTVTFSNTGSLASFTYPGGGAGITLTPTAGGAPFTVSINAGTINAIDGLASFANPSNAVISSQNGYQAGSLQSISVDGKGVISGYFTNGVTRSLAQIALAQFTNPSGLLRSGDNTYLESANSGGPVVGFAGGTIASSITPGALEGSNVDISQEFTDMIIAQRGFQANAKVITTSDEMLQELVNLRR
jgi:flagellar hook protein FlgE